MGGVQKRRVVDWNDELQERGSLTLYHVASPKYTPGDDLLSLDEQCEFDMECVEERWAQGPWAEGGNQDPFDTDLVFFYPDLAQADEHREEFGGVIAEVTLYDDDNIRLAPSAEGYPAVHGFVSGDMVELLDR